MSTKILVIDDEPQFERLLRQRFRRKIREEGFEFTFAQNGIEALELLRQEHLFDIVLSDINMPKMDGLTLLSELRKTKPEIRVIMVSAYGDMSNIRAAMNLGAFDFVTKPINFEDLEATIDKTLAEVEISRRAAMARELERINEQLRDLDAMKSHFFTNISHEFRTPLTVISGMADQLQENPDRWFSQGIRMIKRSSASLLDLVNQILDLAKLESGNLQLRMVQGNVVQYLTYILESFHALAEQKNIQLEFHSGKTDLMMDYDPERLLRIVSNLLSNAVKYTPEGGKVTLAVESRQGTDPQYEGAGPAGSGHLLITVSDSGIGIPEEQLPYIFDRFYQVLPADGGDNRGTGIGLSLTRELIHLMNGRITVNSAIGQGTTFQIQLPIHREAKETATLPDRIPVEPAPLSESLSHDPLLPDDTLTGNRPSLLIVEDNPDIAEYLRACLESQYELLIARDGQAGIELAIEEVPDLIISDVMMPRKDGFELCRTLKTDERTSHIPVVLLTAKADQESKIEGLTRGADAYLTKPFNKQELMVRLEQLLALRRKLQERYKNLEAFTPSEDEAIQQEDAFLKKVRREVEENIDNENMSISSLSRAIGVSRSQLHNKISALTGRSPSVFVRTIRLYKAKELLKNSDLNISQIAFEVGFRDPAYFSRTFSEEFGLSPKEMRN